MGSVCGIIYKSGKAKEAHIMSMLNSMAGWKPDYTGHRVLANAAFGCHILNSMSYSQLEKQPWETDEKLWVYDARFDEGPHFEGNYSDKKPGNEEVSGIKSSAVNRFRKEMIKYLEAKKELPRIKGDFVLAEWDKKKKMLTLMRDPLGARPVFYTETNDFFAFASEMKALFILPGVTRQVDEQWIADSISLVKSEKFRTPYLHIYRLMPAHCLYYDAREVKLVKYWDLKVNPAWENLEEPQAILLFRQKLTQAIERRSRHALCLGSELSGGLDSSGVTAMAYAVAKSHGIPFYAFSHQFSSDKLKKIYPFKDETEFSQELIEHAGIENLVPCTASDLGIIDILEKTRKIQSGPAQQAYNIFADNLYDEAAKRDVKILLSGFGGDEAVSSHAGGYINELRKQKDWDNLRNEMFRTNSGSFFYAFKFRLKFLLIKYFPALLKIIRRCSSGKNKRSVNLNSLALKPEFARRMNIKKRYFAMTGQSVNPDVKSRQYGQILHNHVSQRFEYSCIAALYRRMEYAYPLWDIDLVEFYYSLPSGLKVKKGVKRYIFREATIGILPEKVRTREDKSIATIPTVHQRFLKDYDAIYDLISKAAESHMKNYLDFNKLLAWHERMKNRTPDNKLALNSGAFINSLQLLLWQLEENQLFND